MNNRPICINHLLIFQRILDKTLVLSNDKEATLFASWKVGGQDFYIYAKEAQ